MTEAPKANKTPLPQRRLLRPEAAAPIFGETADWVRSHMRDGSIKTVQIGPVKLIPVSELERLCGETL